MESVRRERVSGGGRTTLAVKLEVLHYGKFDGKLSIEYRSIILHN